MLRHIRMTCRTGTELLPVRLSQILREWAQPLYAFVVQHNVLKPGEPDPVCRCRYPLYTLCYPHPSPYDKLPSSGGLRPLTSSAFPLLLDASAEATAMLSVKPSRAGMESPIVRDGSQTSESMSNAAKSTSSPLTTNIKIHSAFRMRRIWRRRMPPVVVHPNVIPNRPTRYRCDICDGFADLKGHHEASRSEGLIKSVTRGGGEGVQGAQPCSVSGSSSTNSLESEASPMVAKEAKTRILPNRLALKTSLIKIVATEDVSTRGSLDEAREEIDGEHGTRAVSTDIANTIMNDTEVAELRYLDPFLVEVLGCPSMHSLSRYFFRELQAQLNRSSLTFNYITKSIKNTVGISRRYAMAYEAWSQQQSRPQQQEQQQLTGRLDSRNEFLAERFDLAAYTVRFAVAAYGLPYELGYFNAPGDIAKLHARPHCRYACATSDEQIESMRRMLHGAEEAEREGKEREKEKGTEGGEGEGAPPMEFAMSRYATRIGHPSYTVVLDHERRRVVLSFRGPLTLSDFATGLTDGYTSVNLTQPVREGEKGGAPAAESRRGNRARAGGGGAAPIERAETPSEGEDLWTRIPLGVYRATREAAHGVLPALRVIHTCYPDYQLIITGHSLGGAIAVLFHLLYCFQPNATLAPHEVPFSNVQTIAFGAPPLIEEKILKPLNVQLFREGERVGSRLVNFCYGKDLVSRLQLRSVRQILTEQGSLLPVQRSGTEQVVVKKQMPWKANNGSGDVPDWVLPTLAVPGDFLNISDNLQHSCFEVEEDAAWRTQLIFFPEAVFHHHPIHYVRGLNRLSAHYSTQLAEARGRRKKDSNIV